jgi:hypothetical protein
MILNTEAFTLLPDLKTTNFKDNREESLKRSRHKRGQFPFFVLSGCGWPSSPKNSGCSTLLFWD